MEKSNTSSVIIGVSVTIIILLAVAGIVIYFKVSTNFLFFLLISYLLNSVTIVYCEVEILKGCECTEAATMGARTKR